jgi:hypothetical protein
MHAGLRVLTVVVLLVAAPTADHVRVSAAPLTTWSSPQFGLTVSWSEPWTKRSDQTVTGSHDVLELAVPGLYQEFYGINSTETDPAAILHAFVQRFRAVAVPLAGGNAVYVNVDGRVDDVSAEYSPVELGNLIHIPRVDLVAAPVQRQQQSGSEESRTVSARATCVDGSVTVKIANRTRRTLYVAFARAQTGATDAREDVAIENGTDSSMVLSFAGGSVSDNGALVVTSAGQVLPRCGSSVTIDLGPRPSTDADRRAEWPAIAARTISLLEVFGAYDALYALLHPDAKALVSPQQVACWYGEHLADSTTAEAEVVDVAFKPWNWGVNGENYESAEITYHQPYWVSGVREDRDGVEHLVLSGGQWRWFLGNDAGWLASLPSSCSSGGDAGSGSSSVSDNGAECGGANEWWNGTQPRFEEAIGLRQMIGAATATALFDGADRLAELAQLQGSSDPPPAAQALNATLVTVYENWNLALVGAAVLADPDSSNPVMVSVAPSMLDRSLTVGDAARTEASGQIDAFLAACSS